jgi:hypothetical protein
MSRRTAIILVVGLLAFLAFAAWFDISGRDGSLSGSATTAAAKDAATNAPPAATKRATPPPSDNPVVNRNRNERRGPSWSPADPVGKDGKPLEFGRIVPGAFEPVPAGANVKVAVDAGYMERDPQREQSCEGTFWKWKGQLAQGLDVIVDQNQRIAALGMSRNGLETAEGITIGNSFGALVRTYGDRLQGPVRMDYGQAGAFVQNGDRWIGFGMDNQPGQLSDNSRIAFIEVTRGVRPGLLRDGC